MIEKFMQLAIENAKKIKKDIPICAIIVKDNEIISLKLNNKENDNLITSHAEILALEEANKKLNNWRLDDCDMYVTLEPCPMCGWAIKSSRIKNLYFGSYDFNYGSISKYNLFQNSKTKIKGGILEKECDELLNSYFKVLRNGKDK